MKAKSFAQKGKGLSKHKGPLWGVTPRGPLSRNGDFTEVLFALASIMLTAGSAAPRGARRGGPTSVRHRGSGFAVMVGVATPIRTRRRATSS
eukprot:1776262-Pyramimonas_sp.AAC.1